MDKECALRLVNRAFMSIIHSCAGKNTCTLLYNECEHNFTMFTKLSENSLTTFQGPDFTVLPFKVPSQCWKACGLLCFRGRVYLLPSLMTILSQWCHPGSQAFSFTNISRDLSFCDSREESSSGSLWWLGNVNGRWVIMIQDGSSSPDDMIETWFVGDSAHIFKELSLEFSTMFGVHGLPTRFAGHSANWTLTVPSSLLVSMKLPLFGYTAVFKSITRMRTIQFTVIKFV